MTRRTTSLDLPEHRQMAACMASWSSWLGAVADRLDAGRLADADEARSAYAWADRCRRLARRITILRGKETFNNVGPALPRLTLSALFRNDPAYRRFYRIWQDMNAGLASVFGDFLNLPLARTFELYELWCYLRLLRGAAEAWSLTDPDFGHLFLSDAAGGLTLASSAVIVDTGKGWKLCFQKPFREFWAEADRQGSYSRVMVPDIVALDERTDTGRSKLIVLDAKYRIDAGLNDALASIHMYRDAIVQEDETGHVTGVVDAAYLLAPHVAEFEHSYRETAMPARLFHPGYRSSFRFGAVMLRPGMTAPQLAETLRTIIVDAVGAGD